jgi:hypothetical protein
MWTVIELVVLAAIALMSVTEFFIPILTGKPIFGSFREKELPDEEDPMLKNKISSAKEKIQEVKDVQKEVNTHFESARQLKGEADNLLK